VFRLATGFVASQAMAAALRLGLLERLLEAPRDADQLAGELDLPPRSTRRLLQACETLGLVRRVGRFFVPGPLGAPLVDNPEVRTMLAHSDLLYRDLSDPVELMRDPSGSRLSRFWPYARGKDPDPEAAAAYSRLMVASQQLVADEVLAAVDLASHRRLLDVAGGEGAFLARVGRNVPGLDLALFELPAVAERARRRFRETDLEDRVTVHGGDFFDDPLPAGADVVTLSRVLLDHDDPDVRRILTAVHEALAPGGTLVVAEPLAGRDGAGAAVEAYFSLYFLAMGSGRPRTRRELAAMLAAAGFHRIRFPRPRIPVQTGIVTARRRGPPDRSVNGT
jgi:demethylspheroidene O-methyltransferase